MLCRLSAATVMKVAQRHHPFLAWVARSVTTEESNTVLKTGVPFMSIYGAINCQKANYLFLAPQIAKLDLFPGP